MTELEMNNLPQDVLDKLEAEETRYNRCITNLTNAPLDAVHKMKRIESATMKHNRLVDVILFDYTSRKEERTSMGNS